MKKLLIMALTLMVCMCLAACDNSTNNMDFMTVRDMETGKTIALGDTRAYIESALGEAESYKHSDPNGDRYFYANGAVIISYDEDDTATYIHIDYDIKRFEFKHIPFDMNIEDVENISEYSNISGLGFSDYRWFYDSKGNIVNEADADYETGVFTLNDGVSACYTCIALIE